MRTLRASKTRGMMSSQLSPIVYDIFYHISVGTYLQSTLHYSPVGKRNPQLAGKMKVRRKREVGCLHHFRAEQHTAGLELEIFLILMRRHIIRALVSLDLLLVCDFNSRSALLRLVTACIVPGSDDCCVARCRSSFKEGSTSASKATGHLKYLRRTNYVHSGYERVVCTLCPFATPVYTLGGGAHVAPIGTVLYLPRNAIVCASPTNCCPAPLCTDRPTAGPSVHRTSYRMMCPSFSYEVDKFLRSTSRKPFESELCRWNSALFTTLSPSVLHLKGKLEPTHAECTMIVKKRREESVVSRGAVQNCRVSRNIVKHGAMCSSVF